MENRAITKSVSFYPEELAKIEKAKKEHGYRKFSQAVQHIVKQYGKNDVKVLTAVKGA